MLLSVACRAPTEVTLELRTNIDCKNPSLWKGVAVYVGTPGQDVESKAPTSTTTDCSNGQIGTLTIVPAAGTDAEIGIRVVAGLDRNPEDCRASGYQGCIVARRTVRFRPHEALSLVVDLTTDCVGLACDSARTCVNATCVDSRQSVVDQVSTDPEAGPHGPVVRCGDNAVKCETTGNVCCLTVDQAAKTATGACLPVGECPATSSILYCDDDSDCAGVPTEDGAPAVCCISGATGGCNLDGSIGAGAQCISKTRCRTQLVLCEDRNTCQGLGTCEPIKDPVLPGYFACCYMK